MGLPFNSLIRDSLLLCIFLQGKKTFFRSMDPLEVEEISPGTSEP